MSTRLAMLGLAAALLASAGCSKDESSPAAPATPTLTALPATVRADGVATTTLTVTGGAAPFSLLTSRGTFANGDTSISVAAVNGFAVLRPCDARQNAACAGPAVVTAAGADGGLGQVVVQFQGFENCSNGVDDNGDGARDCADPQCPLDSPCGANGLLCSATAQCNKCTVPNNGVVDASGETHCGDAVDNDCDGRIDCADPDCGSQSCTTTTGSIGLCGAGVCACAKTETVESVCGDGRDNDCDTLVDCADPDCVGDVCDATRGLVCAGVAPLTCRVCPSGQTSESADQCGDGKDNDCDGQADCHDADCQPVVAGGSGQVCNPWGGVCRLTAGVPSCGCSGGATTETSCSDGVDNDCDGGTDCGDDDCQPAGSGLAGPGCGPNGRACTSAGTCACPTGAVELCNNYDASGAPVDDDCDGQANCADRDCRPATPGGEGADCSSPDQFGMACSATGACACTGNGAPPEASEVTCDDGVDNDCDFLLDCEDPDCSTGTPRSCGPPGATCSATTLTCVCANGTTESSCTDGVDNDCNGKTDCEEPSCAARACSTAPALAGYRCISGACADPATQYAVTVTPERSRIPASAGAATLVNVVVTYRGTPRAGETVDFTLSDPTLGTVAPTSRVTDSQGRAQVTFTGAGRVGVETLTATVASVGAAGTATVEMPAIGEIRLLEPRGILHAVMGVRTSGFQEQNELVVEVLDAARRPYPDGLDVVFEHMPLGGSTLSSPLATPACAVTPCVQSRAQTTAGGLAQVRLYSGTVAGTLRVSAAAVAGSVTRRFELPTIPVVGAKPNAGHFSIVCGPENVPALAGSTCHVSTIDAPFTCVALLKDRYGNLLGRSTSVSFMSEAGAVGSPALTPEYDPARAPTEQTELGSAVQIVETLGAKLPKDVLPNAGEERIATTADTCGITTRNPRDGVVTVVAWTPGEEAFFDANGNGQYDAAEPFIDLPEPFVDYDDDDTRDADEPYVDSDADGAWDGPNGRWDTSANVWTKTVVVYSGMPAFYRSGALDYTSRWMELSDGATYAAATPVASFAIRPEFPPDPFTDCDGDRVRDATTAEPFEDANRNGRYDAAEAFVDTNGNGAYDAGETFTDSNGNGRYDPAEGFTDCNGNGTRDLAVVEVYEDVNGNGRYDASGTAATSETLVVAATDRNLNRLDTSTRYEVAAPGDVGFDVSFSGLPSLPDRRGLRFGFQPCLASSPATCALDCADISTPLAPVCRMRTTVNDFTYGYTAAVKLTGGAVGSADGATEVYWDITLLEERLRIAVPGTHQ